MRSDATFAIRAARWAFHVVMAVGVVLIGWTSLPYFFGDEIHDFILERLPVPHERVWLAALHVHVASALCALPACLALLSRRLLRSAPRVHRVLGRVTGGAILFALVPSGAWLALYARGGGLSTLGFLTSGAIVAVSMIRAIAQARARDFAAHRRSVLHVVAQLSVAVSSRAMLLALDRWGIQAEQAYVAALWIPVLASALVASLLTLPRRLNHAKPALRLADHSVV